MRLAYSLLVISFAVQSFAYLGQMFNIFYPFNFGLTTTTPQIFGIFQIDLITGALVGAGAIAIGIGAILTRSGTYALYALLIYGIGVCVTQVQKFILAIPNLLSVVPFPNFPGTTISTSMPIIGFIGGLMVFAWGWFLVELITQRQHT
jgi:hypothetical protein